MTNVTALSRPWPEKDKGKKKAVQASPGNTEATGRVLSREETLERRVADLEAQLKKVLDASHKNIGDAPNVNVNVEPT